MTDNDIQSFVGNLGRISREAVHIVSDATGIPPVVILSKERTREVARARHAAMAICRDRGMSLHAIGKAFNRDHTSVLNGLRRVQQWKESR
jgi:chromosomal replication initiation ATPase DnaA